jgi:hypothetical protein
LGVEAFATATPTATVGAIGSIASIGRVYDAATVLCASTSSTPGASGTMSIVVVAAA